MIEADLRAWLADGLRAGRPRRSGSSGDLPDAGAPGAPAEGARRLRDERRPRPRETRRDAPARCRRRRSSDALAPVPVRREGRVGRARVHQHLDDRRVAASTWSAGSRPRASATAARAPTGERVQVEFVSANPTGPLHVGHARNAVLGDAIARLLDVAGHTVEREYYFNDAGGQMDRFGASVEARYLQALGRDAEVPEDGYHGDYIAEYAEDIVREHGDALADLPAEERFVRLRARGRAASHGRDPRDPGAVRRRVRHLRVRGVARGARVRSPRRSTGLRAAGPDLRGRRRRLVPLHRLRRRQGSHRDPLQRAAHVLRRRSART